MATLGCAVSRRPVRSARRVPPLPYRQRCPRKKVITNMYRSLKPLRLLAVTGAVALALSACSSTSTTDQPSGASGAANGNAPSWCGSKKISLGLTDGFGGNSWRLVTTAAAKNEVAKCPSVTSFTYADGQGNTQKAISDIQGMVAKGVNALVVFPDAGKAILPGAPERAPGGREDRPLSSGPWRHGRHGLRRLGRGRLHHGRQELGQLDPQEPAQRRERPVPLRPEGQQPGHHRGQGPALGSRPDREVQVHR